MMRVSEYRLQVRDTVRSIITMTDTKRVQRQFNAASSQGWRSKAQRDTAVV